MIIFLLGYPMKLIYFVSPYDLLDKRSNSPHPLTVEGNSFTGKPVLSKLNALYVLEELIVSNIFKEILDTSALV